jgi:hypothetical protein
MGKEKIELFNFKDLREKSPGQKLKIEVSILYMASTRDYYIKIKDNQKEEIQAFLANIQEYSTLFESYTKQKKVILECELKSEYYMVNLFKQEEIVKEDKVQKSKKNSKNNEKVIIEPEVKEETVEVVEDIKTQDVVLEDVKHVNKTIEQEIKESIYKNPINLNLIKENPELKLDLSEYGINNTQIFTRKVDIDKMIESIGLDYIKNPETTILEPTSGDGAFTTRILELRLENFKDENLEGFLLKSLTALSTIYSIEYELASLEVQRNNMYTLMIKFLCSHIVTEEDKELFAKKEEKWKKLVKEIIFYNIIWGATATELDPDYLINTSPSLGKYRSNDMPIVIRKWDIKKDLRYRFTNII